MSESLTAYEGLSRVKGHNCIIALVFLSFLAGQKSIFTMGSLNDFATKSG
jgi:hypothetical protein